MTEPGPRRYTDKISKEQKHEISRIAFLLAGLLIAVCSASLLFVGYMATQASEKEALRTQRYLFQNTLRDRSDVIVREQLTLARWDETVRRVVVNFDHDFVRQELKSMWHDFGHDHSLIVNGDDVVIAEAFEGYTHIVRRPLTETMEFLPIVNQARAIFQERRTRVPGGFSFASIQNLPLNKIAAFGFMKLDERPALVSAIPITPDREQVALPEGHATVLVSVQFLDDKFLQFLNAQIRFGDLKFVLGPNDTQSGASSKVYDVEGLLLGYFAWRELPVAAPVWDTVIPVILLLSTALGFLAFAIAWKIGRLTSSLQASERQNRFLAMHDTLSGLANRLYFNRALSEAVKNTQKRSFALLHCDLDRFKQVNDTHGHAAGDLVIQEIAKRLSTLLGDKGLACRVGGDEFMLIFTRSTNRSALKRFCNQLLEAIPEPIDIGHGHTADVGLSIGIAIVPEHGYLPEDIQAAADEALYRAKNAGRGRMAFALTEAEKRSATTEQAEEETHRSERSTQLSTG